MKKLNTTPISGMQELLPGLQAEFNRLKGGIEAAYHAHGFQSIETPTIDRAEILLAKAGGDTEKQIYKVVKTAEAAEGADQALRFDHTVPLARYVVEHANDLAFPFKVTQIGRNFRGERAQKGRFREFYQCDADVIGWGDLPIAYDADVIMTLIDALRKFPLPGILVRVNNRKLIAGMLSELNLEHLSGEILNIIDHSEKVAPEKTIEALESLGIGSENVVKITTFIEISGSSLEIEAKLKEFGFESPLFQEGLDELCQVLTSLERQLAQSVDGGRGKTGQTPQVSIIADLKIVRGLDYYTGTVFETIVPGHREIGSICGGGRYENLAEYYTDQPLPGVGGSIGLTRLFYILREYKMIQTTEMKPLDVCLVPLSSHELPTAETLAAKLRTEGQRVDIILTNKKLGTKMTYAAKIAHFACVIGETEVETGKFQLKNLETGEISEREM